MLFFTSKDRGPKILAVGLYRGKRYKKDYVGSWSCIVYVGNMASVRSCRYSERCGNKLRLGVMR